MCNVLTVFVQEHAGFLTEVRPCVRGIFQQNEEWLLRPSGLTAQRWFVTDTWPLRFRRQADKTTKPTDSKEAFLQVPIPETRDVWVKPPPEADAPFGAAFR